MQNDHTLDLDAIAVEGDSRQHGMYQRADPDAFSIVSRDFD